VNILSLISLVRTHVLSLPESIDISATSLFSFPSIFFDCAKEHVLSLLRLLTHAFMLVGRFFPHFLDLSLLLLSQEGFDSPLGQFLLIL